MAKRKKPIGSRWRILAQDDKECHKVDLRTEHGPVFDELVIDDWLHLEQMSDRCWYLNIGGVRLDIFVGTKGVDVTYDDQILKPEILYIR